MKILCVIVLYKCSLIDSTSFNGIRHELLKYKVPLLVYDNSPEISRQSFHFEGLNIKYVCDTSNPGISKAYNFAASYAKGEGYEWVLFFDQDTMLPRQGFLESLYESEKKYPDISLFAPTVISNGGEKMSPSAFGFMCSKDAKIGINCFDGLSCINSGLCIRVSSFWEVGGYNESVALDFSDHQFIDRYKSKYNLFCVIDYILQQEYSNEVKDFKAAYTRFLIYRKNYKEFKSNKLSTSLYVKFMYYKHVIALVMRYKTLIFFE